MAFPIAAIGLGLGLATSAFTSISGAIRARQARNAIDDIERKRIQYENNFKNVQVSTLGSDLQRDMLQQGNASLIGQMRAGGSRAMIGAIPQILSNNALVSRQIGAGLDEQQSRIDVMEADYQNKIQEVYDERQRDALKGYGQELMSSRQDVVTGMNNMAGIGLASASMFGGTNQQALPTDREQFFNQFQESPTGGVTANRLPATGGTIGGIGYNPSGFSQYAGQNWQGNRFVYPNPAEYGTDARLNQYRY